jgi:hypothetical protein
MVDDHIILLESVSKASLPWWLSKDDRRPCFGGVAGIVKKGLAVPSFGKKAREL